MTIESAAGKNAVMHVGKLYNIAASLIAQRLVEEVGAVEEARCLLVSQIGSPLDRPQAIDVAVRVRRGSGEPQRQILSIVEEELTRIGSIAAELAEGRRAIGRRPVRAAAV